MRRDEVAVWVRDLDSPGGTWVNDRQLYTGQATCRLCPDDVIRVCETWVRLGATMPVNADWVHWNDGTLVKIAQVIHDERAYDHLPILADALEEAGCDDADILSHCRAPGPHVGRSWVIDLLLGKSLGPPVT